MHEITGVSKDRSFGTDDAPHVLPHSNAPSEPSAAPSRSVPPDCERISPHMLSLVDLDQQQIDSVVSAVPGGARNVRDIYPLTSLQEGMLFHHLLNTQSDTYIVSTLLECRSRAQIELLVIALQTVIDRHDILRTAVVWEHLPRPVQVVYRRATLPVEELALEPHREAVEQLKEFMLPQRQRWDLRRAPLMRLRVAREPSGTTWYALIQLHHVICDHGSLKAIVAEAMSHIEGRAHQLPQSAPYRAYIERALASAQTKAAEAYFSDRLSAVDEPTAPFGLLDVQGDGSRLQEVQRPLHLELAQRVRKVAREHGVSAARLFHAVWALVVAHTSGRDDVVFGTALLATTQRRADAQSTLGMFVNTLPLRLNLTGLSALELIRLTQHELAELLKYEETSLIAAQRCSGVAASAPLFTSLIGYRHSVPDPATDWSRVPGMRVLTANQYRTNYPVSLTVDNLGEGFSLIVQTDKRIDPRRVADYVETGMRSLLDALQQAPQTPALALSILPELERYQVLESFNATTAAYPQGASLQALFSQQAARQPNAVAVVYEDQRLTYSALNERANQLAHYLIQEGVQIGEYVPLLMPRNAFMLVAQLALLKVGATYVPVDPTHPIERQAFIARDCNARSIIAERGAADALNLPLRCFDWTRLEPAISDLSIEDPDLPLATLPPAYVMYTSGSTGTPKGVVISHRAISRLALNNGYARIEPSDCVAHYSNPAFDASTFEIWGALLNGARVVVVPQDIVLHSRRFAELLAEHSVTVLWMTVGLFTQYKEALAGCFAKLNYLIVGGDVVDLAAIRWVLEHCPPRHLLNAYGPTECTTFSTTYLIKSIDDDADSIPIGRPISNTRIYVLDRRMQPVPIGAAGEIFIGGAGLALSYLNRTDLTAERFVPDPFSNDATARIYRTGDLGRWRPDGAIEFLGRIDEQVKIRGYRIEPTEVAAQLREHEDVKEAVVVARPTEAGEKQLVAYVVPALERMRAKREDSAGELGEDVVTQWKMLYEQTYSARSTGPSFVGWNSSYTGEPIPEVEMREWLAGTVSRIESLHPTKVLEIGCGVGLVLQHIAPRCLAYVGTDFSIAALEQLREWVGHHEGLSQVQLLHRAATELQDLPTGAFDTVVLNSVVQYFPDVEYLLTVLRGAVRLLVPGGKIFIGDVRHLGSLPLLHSAVQFGKAHAALSIDQLKKRVARAVSQDKELVIDPQLFRVLAGNLPGISAADVQIKRGRSENELTRHRYDVTLHVGHAVGPSVCCDVVEWAAVGSTLEFERALQERRWCSVRLQGVPNRRLINEGRLHRLIDSADERYDVTWLRQELQEQSQATVEPEDLWHLAEAYGYDITVSPAEHDSFDVGLVDRARRDQIVRAPGAPTVAKPWSAYANDPLDHGVRQQLVPQLREYLKARLPDYMLPSAWVVLKHLPLTANGKVDRRALPSPAERPEDIGRYQAPRTELERTLAEIWGQLLRVDQVGVKDSFFDLGGHSLLATRVISRARDVLKVELPIRVLFEAPTIELLARYIESESARITAHQTERGDERTDDLRRQIDGMSDDAVLTELAQLERDLRISG